MLAARIGSMDPTDFSSSWIKGEDPKALGASGLAAVEIASLVGGPLWPFRDRVVW